MTIKLIAIDMDGTLLNEHGDLNPETIKTVKEAKERGIKIVLCTGRPLMGIERFLPVLELDQVGDYAITYNGALVQHTADGHVIAKHTLTYDDYLRIEYTARRLGVHSHAEDENISTPLITISPVTPSTKLSWLTCRCASKPPINSIAGIFSLRSC